MSLNQSLFQFIYGWSHRSPVLDGIGIFTAEYLPYLMVAGFLFVAFGRKESRARIAVFFEGSIAVIFASGIVVEAIHFFYHHLRPFDALNFTPLISESGYSFPSGHAAWFFALSMIVFYYSRKWGIWYFILSILMGVARIYVGVHWPLDILGGAAVGILCGIFAHALIGPSVKKMEAPESAAA